MKLIIRKSLVAAAILSVSGIVSAASGVVGATTLPPEPNWHVGVEINALGAVNDDLHFAQQSVVPVAPYTVNNVAVLDTHYDIGLRIETGIHFENSNDISVDYTYFESDDTSSVHTNLNPGGIARFLPVDTFADAGAEFEYHNLNVEFGHTQYWGDNTMYRFHAGVQVSHLDDKLSIHAYDPTGTEIFDIHPAESEFTGAGPRAGADSEYEIGKNFSLVGHTSGALLLGDLKSHGETHDVDNLILVEKVTNSMSETVIVPAAEAKLGVKYVHQMASNNTFSWEGGYRVTAYLNPIKWLGGTIATDTPWSSNFALYGVYLAGRFTAI